MNIYLYTENFETQGFDIFVFDSKSKLLTRIPHGPDSQSRLKWLSEHEAPEEIKDGISTWGSSGAKAFLSFKIQIDQLAPSGRTRLIFGTTESVWITSQLEESIDFILMGIDALLKECSLTIPLQRMQRLQKCLERNYQNINAIKKTFQKKAFGVGLLVAGSIMLAKSNHPANLPNGINNESALA